mgnify:CR=1 FL=1
MRSNNSSSPWLKSRRKATKETRKIKHRLREKFRLRNLGAGSMLRLKICRKTMLVGLMSKLKMCRRMMPFLKRTKRSRRPSKCLRKGRNLRMQRLSLLKSLKRSTIKQQSQLMNSHRFWILNLKILKGWRKMTLTVSLKTLKKISLTFVAKLSLQGAKYKVLTISSS